MYIACLSHDPLVSLVGLWCLLPLRTIFSAIMWHVSFIGEGNGVPGENHRYFASQCQTLSHNIISSTPQL
jgi:hypothetical protein